MRCTASSYCLVSALYRPPSSVSSAAFSATACGQGNHAACWLRADKRQTAGMCSREVLPIGITQSSPWRCAAAPPPAAAAGAARPRGRPPPRPAAQPGLPCTAAPAPATRPAPAAPTPPRWPPCAPARCWHSHRIGFCQCQHLDCSSCALHPPTHPPSNNARCTNPTQSNLQLIAQTKHISHPPSAPLPQPASAGPPAQPAAPPPRPSGAGTCRCTGCGTGSQHWHAHSWPLPSARGDRRRAGMCRTTQMWRGVGQAAGITGG